MLRRSLIMVDRICNVLEIITVWIAFREISGKKIEIDKLAAAFLGSYIVIVAVANEYDNFRFFGVVIYPLTFLYVLLLNNKKVLESFFKWLFCIVFISVLQLALIGIVTGVFGDLDNDSLSILLVNSLVMILVMVLFRKQYLVDKKILVEVILENIIMCLVILAVGAAMIYTVKRGRYINSISAIGIAMFVLLTFCVVYIFQKEKKIIEYKKDEIKMEQVYSDTYSELIGEIRRKQHSFDNHINAIMGITVVAKDIEEARRKQQEYTQVISEENRFNKMLQTGGSPVITGFLYNKFVEVSNRGVNIVPKLAIGDMKCRLRQYDLINIMGVLIDNAVEAASNVNSDGKDVLFTLKETNEKIIVRVENSCQYFEKSQIAKFFENGYSTKGDRRGIGLYDVKKLVEDVKGDIFADTKASKEDNTFTIEIAILKQ
ncbi:MAG: GHKL domain-containing protein [Lachnospiraceae bacterium]|nr:GHKL domain-containing protein [Lachnospiraceae bacterium]